MTDIRKEFEEWFLNQYGVHYKHAQHQFDHAPETFLAWQACQSLNDKRINDLLAVIKAKDEALQIAIEYQHEACQYFHDSMAGYKEHEHERYREDLKETKEALAIKPGDVELQSVGRVINDRSGVHTIGKEMYTLSSGTLLYTIKTKGGNDANFG